MFDYYTFVDDGNAVRTELDLSLIEEAPQDERGWLAWLFVKIKSPDDMQWCSEHECEILLTIQQRLSKRIEEKLNGVMVGVRMQEGWQEFYFYLPTAKKFENSAAEVMRSFEGYAYDTGTAKDFKWDKYRRELYPDAMMAQQIDSRYIINELEEEGDDLNVERNVEHYLFFQTLAQAERTAESLGESGFTLKETVEQDDTYAYGIVMTKIHAVNEETLMQETLGLFQAAAKEHGVYEGWSTVLST
ncbi:MAG: hypothetical protein DRG24_07945 [Epsilonproteobacteria bacterium]|nr:MAG: hypothetical protein DRG24_07945 [Campylobacterota bacterium]